MRKRKVKNLMHYDPNLTLKIKIDPPIKWKNLLELPSSTDEPEKGGDQKRQKAKKQKRP
jgi:hypothetical protein